MFGNTCSLHVSFVSRNPTTTHCNNTFCSVPCSALFADQQPLCFKCFPQPAAFMLHFHPTAFVFFLFCLYLYVSKCFPVGQQPVYVSNVFRLTSSLPLCVCLWFLSFLCSCSFSTVYRHFFICFLSSLPPFFFFFDWWTSQF